MEAAAGAAAAAAERQGATLVVASARLRQGAAMLHQGREDEATALFENAKALYEAAGDRAGVARALNNLASAISDGPDTRRTKALYEEGLAIARAVGEQSLVARFLSNMAIQERRAGNLQASLRMNQESLAIRREIGDRTTAAVSLNNIGNVLLDMGNLKAASEHYEQSAAADPRDRRSARPGAGLVQRGRVASASGQPGPRPRDGRARRSRFEGASTTRPAWRRRCSASGSSPRSKATWRRARAC